MFLTPLTIICFGVFLGLLIEETGKPYLWGPFLVVWVIGTLVSGDVDIAAILSLVLFVPFLVLVIAETGKPSLWGPFLGVWVISSMVVCYHLSVQNTLNRRRP